VFDVSDGDWVPSGDSSLPTRAQVTGDAEAADASRALAELRAELAVLRASHARLRDRVVALEASQSGIAQPQLRPMRGGRPQRRRSEPPAAFTEAHASPAQLANNPGFAATQASPGVAGATGHAAAPAPAASANSQVGASPSFEELARAFAGEQLPAVLGLPSIESVTDCFAMLMGTVPELERSPEIAFDSLERGHLCRLLDDDGRERGAIMLDLKAAVMLGAALLALPREEALKQVSEREPSEDALLATSEICNNLTGPINAVSGNAHVRSTALTALGEADVGALPKPRGRLDLVVEGGRVVLAMF
jgi:hypothetical protein